MKCPNCGFNFSEGCCCPDCGVDVYVFRKARNASIRLYNEARPVPTGRGFDDTGYGNAIVPRIHFAATLARICSSISSVMRERSHSGFHPHSSRAQVSSSELGQLAAISFFTGSTS